MRLLDLFCGAGGAAVGYARAGFEVVGVDINPQPHYPFEIHQADAMSFPLDGYDVIHASPPCQLYIRGGNVNRAKHRNLLPPTRERLQRCGLPWVIENVPGAPMRPDVMLCGSQFGLEVRRHRYFEFSTPPTVLLAPCDHSQPVTGVYGHPHGADGAYPGMLPGDLETWSRAMGIDWMNTAELADAIPPAYTEFIGALLLEHLEIAGTLAKTMAKLAARWHDPHSSAMRRAIECHALSVMSEDEWRATLAQASPCEICAGTSVDYLGRPCRRCTDGTTA